ncbi:roadblock/LC7 domain-containing protein [Saccharopolyspora sp. K220]|uniref:roadblock/LC7 domain-containing protein n=1 Tax=Saccharopolyspora soli TaxID=2926618 RepID=UPI001F591740|nr:roadblock/LC7 domain-containing protein [Saccharopolyspora soli]MCI2415803.1 roadblock/LC7 domain-containing protein [Saccharopolyspora soli]
MSSKDVSWLLDEFGRNVVGVRDSVLLSADGLCVAKSERLPEEKAEELAAMAASMQALATKTGSSFDGGSVRQTIIEMDYAFLFLAEVGYGTRLAVLAGDGVDVEMIGQQMASLVERVGERLSTPPRGKTDEQSREHA